MKKLLLLLCAFVASVSGAWGQDTNLTGAVGVTAKIGETDVANVLNGNGAQPNNYDGNDEMNIVVDLQSSKTINSFSITFSGDRWVSEFDLSYSTDGSSYTKIATYQTGRTAQDPETTIAQAFGSSVIARYIKYTSKKSNKNVQDVYSEGIKNFQLLSYDTSIPSHEDVSFAIYTKDAKDVNWQNGYNGGATKGSEVTYNGVPAQEWTVVKCLYFGRPSWESEYNLGSYNKVSLDIYASAASEDYKIGFETNSAEKAISLTAGWNTVTWDLSSDVATRGRLRIYHKDLDEATSTIDMKIANIYLAEPAEEEKYIINSLTATPVFVQKNVATALTFVPKNASGVDMTAYGDSKVTLAYAITSGTGTLSDGNLTITGDDPVVITATATRVSDSHESTATATVNVVSEAIPAAKQGTTPTNDVIFYNSTTPGSWNGAANTTIGDEVTIFGSKAKVIHLGSNVSMSVTTESQMKDNNRASVAIYPLSSFDGAVVVDSGNKFENFASLTANKWNVFDFAFTSDATDVVTTFKVINNSGSAVDVLVANVVVYYKEPGSFDYDTSADGKTVTVTGNVTESNISTINTFTAPKLDLTGVSSWTATSAIESPNPNQIIVVGCTYTGTDANPGVITPAINVANTKNVVAYTGYYFALTPIEITDNNSYQPWSGSINTNYGSNGYTITRTVAADKYVSAYFPTTATNVSVTNGTIYELDATNSTKSEVKFNKVTTIGGGAPFIVHTTGDATISVTGSGDLNMGENGGNTAQIAFASGAALFKGNLIAKAGTGAEWGLQSSTGAAPVFKQIGTGATIGSFRAYFTGLSETSSARAIFDDGDGTTAIKSIESIMNQDDVYYNLNGQRVLNPTKGLYIVNGKKVILK